MPADTDMAWGICSVMTRNPLGRIVDSMAGPPAGWRAGLTGAPPCSIMVRSVAPAASAATAASTAAAPATAAAAAPAATAAPVAAAAALAPAVTAAADGLGTEVAELVADLAVEGILERDVLALAVG